jgi:uncharacterized RDD family membrane protein YckC
MKNTLTLTKKETFFLKENRQDPVTGDSFEIGDKIVFCASCKSAFLIESWEYMNSKHCGQIVTLNNFPISSKLTLSKPIVYNFKDFDSGNRILAYMIDNAIAIFLGVVIYFLIIGFEENMFVPFHIIIGSFYMIFRDVLGGKGSLGKRIMGLYFIDSKTKQIAPPFLLLFRNLIYWFCLFVVISIITILEVVIDAENAIAIAGGFFLVIANITHVIAVLANQNNIFDRMLNLELVEKK